MTTLRAFTSALILAAVVSGPAHAEMVSATKPSTKAAESKPKHDAKDGHADKKKHASNTEKKSKHDGAKAAKEKTPKHAPKAAHAAAKPEKKNAHAKPKHPREEHKDARPDKRVATRDQKKERHGAH